MRTVKSLYNNQPLCNGPDQSRRTNLIVCIITVIFFVILEAKSSALTTVLTTTIFLRCLSLGTGAEFTEKKFKIQVIFFVGSVEHAKYRGR